MLQLPFSLFGVAMEPPETLRPIAEQAFVGKQWPSFSPDWVLRPCGSIHDMDSSEFNELRYQHFHLPLLKASNKEQEWIVYRLSLCSLGYRSFLILRKMKFSEQKFPVLLRGAWFGMNKAFREA